MFAEFLFGLALLTMLVLVVLLVAPRPNDDIRAARLPILGALLASLVAALALLTSQVA